MARPERFELPTLWFEGSGSQILSALSSVAYGRGCSKICHFQNLVGLQGATKMSRAYIYELFDPRQPESPRVVGKTIQSLRARLAGYINGAKRFRSKGHPLIPSARWVLHLVDKGVLPEIRMIEQCPFAEWKNRERHWIAIYRARGYLLLNVHPGGNGTSLPGAQSKKCPLCSYRKWWLPNIGLYCPAGCEPTIETLRARQLRQRCSPHLGQLEQTEH